MPENITVGVLALQGAFYEHLKLLKEAAPQVDEDAVWKFIEVRNSSELAQCNALIIPGGESTTMSLVASRSNLLEPLREFVKVHRNPTWGTCAGLILLAESANRTKKGGQDLIGGLDVRVNRNHFGRQTESFEANLNLPFLTSHDDPDDPVVSSVQFNGIFIRAPIVEKLLPIVEGEQVEEAAKDDTVTAPSRPPVTFEAKTVVNKPVEIMAILPGRRARLVDLLSTGGGDEDVGDIIAVRQGNVFGTSFHPELTQDPRVHVWWLQEVYNAMRHRTKRRLTMLQLEKNRICQQAISAT